MTAGLARAAATLACGIALTVVASLVTVSNVLGDYNPGILRYWPLSSKASLAEVQRLLRRGASDGTALSRSAALAAAVLTREPANAVAARSLGQVRALQKDIKGAERLHLYAETMSRRDVPTQIWLIETHVARNDIPGALRHYDRALRVSLATRDILYPVLIGASATPEIADELAKVVQRRPNWWQSFADAFIQQSSSPRSLTVIVSRLRLDSHSDVERKFLSRAMQHLIDLKSPDAAHRLYLDALRRSAGPAAPLLRNGGFEDEPAWTPFDWTVSQIEEGHFVRERRQDANGSHVMSLYGASTADRIMQIVRVDPGSYRIGASFGAVPTEPVMRPALTISCVGKENELLVRLSPPAAAAKAVAQFNVPAGCRYLRVAIMPGASNAESADGPWIDNITLSPN